MARVIPIKGSQKEHRHERKKGRHVCATLGAPSLDASGLCQRLVTLFLTSLRGRAVFSNDRRPPTQPNRYGTKRSVSTENSIHEPP